VFEIVVFEIKLLDIFIKIWAPIRKLFALPGVPSWLQAWSDLLQGPTFFRFGSELRAD